MHVWLVPTRREELSGKHPEAGQSTRSCVILYVTILYQLLCMSSEQKISIYYLYICSHVNRYVILYIQHVIFYSWVNQKLWRWKSYWKSLKAAIVNLSRQCLNELMKVSIQCTLCIISSSWAPKARRSVQLRKIQIQIMIHFHMYANYDVHQCQNGAGYALCIVTFLMHRSLVF